MDNLDIYHIALILNPRYKVRLLKQELGDNAASIIIQQIKDVLHWEYPPIPLQSLVSSSSQFPRQILEAKLLSKIQPSTSLILDIDRYFSDLLAHISEESARGASWLFNWLRIHKDEYPRMATAARDYLAIPALEVLVERLFSVGRYLIGLRRHSLHANTMQQLLLLRYSIQSSQ